MKKYTFIFALFVFGFFVVSHVNAQSADPVTALTITQEVRNITQNSQFAKTASAKQGDTIEYKIVITNLATATANTGQLSLTDSVPVGITPTNNVPAVYKSSLDFLGVDRTWTTYLRAITEKTGSFVNTVSVMGGPNLTASTTVTVVAGSGSVPPKPDVPVTPTESMCDAPLTANLSYRNRSAQVSILQQFLVGQELLDEENVSGYFGVLTRGAVQKFQIKNSIASVGDTGYGQVGPRTRELINKLCGGGTAPTTNVNAGETSGDTITTGGSANIHLFASLLENNSYKISWTSSGVASCTSNDFYIPSDGTSKSGSVIVTTSRPTTYSILCLKASGSEEAHITVTPAAREVVVVRPTGGTGCTGTSCGTNSVTTGNDNTQPKCTAPVYPSLLMESWWSCDRWAQDPTSVFYGYTTDRYLKEINTPGTMMFDRFGGLGIFANPRVTPTVFWTGTEWQTKSSHWTPENGNNW